ncbi:hypothetical protein BTM25_27560 [Actinomadura rubteroloni]|uniref:DUF308 domain-containing protein n=1 Tax=Actinomadura rubteroloni TaxID=1926885 RepID=A0A2P4UGH8_9ACTN|nr:hypothetical protein [Actinomadura rubteroloni]POM24129.1 hypothetical protein BTM25_27560 [Actinomadura rubteroloni]
MNRRGNGLTADAYAPLVDLAPHLADAMLAALRDAGVAAYATGGGAGDAGPVLPDVATDAPQPGDGEPLDRLFVDVAMKPTAEGVLRVHLTRLRDAGGAEPPEPAGALPAAPDPEPDPEVGGAAVRDEDAIWAEIVAGFDAEVPEGERVPWPDEEDLREPSGPPGDDRAGRLPRARVLGPADEDEEEFPPADDDGHFVPPHPGPLPQADPVTKGAWIALVGGPLYLLVTVLLDWEVPGWAAFLAVAAFIGGFVTLVLRMGDEPRDPDGGAVV